jgi:nitrogen fixation protein FixH
MKQSASATPMKGEFTGRHMLMIMVAFFGLVIAVNILLAVKSVETFSGLVVNNSYVASQTFDKDTDKLAADAAMDVHPELSIAHGMVHLKLATAAGQPIEAQNLHLTLGHAVSASTDQALVFASLGMGEFEAKANLTGGYWQGQLTVTLPDGAAWERAVRLKIE